MKTLIIGLALIATVAGAQMQDGVVRGMAYAVCGGSSRVQDASITVIKSGVGAGQEAAHVGFYLQKSDYDTGPETWGVMRGMAVRMSQAGNTLTNIHYISVTPRKKQRGRYAYDDALHTVTLPIEIIKRTPGTLTFAQLRALAEKYGEYSK